MFKVVFHQGNYTCIDYEGSEENCREVATELTAQLRAAGEKDFYYSVEEV